MVESCGAADDGACIADRARLTLRSLMSSMVEGLQSSGSKVGVNKLKAVLGHFSLFLQQRWGVEEGVTRPC